MDSTRTFPEPVKKYTIYVLELTYGRFYVGKSTPENL